MDTLFIFGAKYLFILPIIIVLIFLYKSEPDTRNKIMIFTLILLPLTFIISLIARELYFNPRPFVVGGYEPLISHVADNGFPSDHTLLVSALAGLIMFFNKRVGLWLWFIAAIVGLSRIYVGVHDPLDIMASTLIALFSTFVVYIILKARKGVIMSQ